MATFRKVSRVLKQFKSRRFEFLGINIISKWTPSFPLMLHVPCRSTASIKNDRDGLVTVLVIILVTVPMTVLVAVRVTVRVTVNLTS